MKLNSWWDLRGCRVVGAVLLMLLPVSSWAEPVTLRHAVELALKHATSADIAAADEQHAFANYRELRSSFIPQVTAGAGLGWTYGFPLSLEGAAPALFNVTAQSPLLHFEMRDYLAAARADVTAASLHRKDQRAQLIQDTALSYAELQKWEQRLARLKISDEEAQKMQAAVEQRVKEGIDSELEHNRARLSAARIRLRIAEAEGAASVLRERLARLTGLPAASIQTEDALPTVRESTPQEAADSVDANPSVKASVENARSQYLRAQAEHKAWLPSMDFAAQYAVLSTFNNYEDYFQQGSFKRNNATIGAVLRFPFLNISQRARAQAAAADALKAKKQSEAARDQVSEETLRLQNTVAQMRAAREVSQLEYEIAQSNLQATQTRAEAGTASFHDMDDSRSQVSERFIALQDITFELERSQIGLMRATGNLENWALGTP